MTMQLLLNYRLDLIFFALGLGAVISYAYIGFQRKFQRSLPPTIWIYFFIVLIIGMVAAEFAQHQKKEELVKSISGFAPPYAMQMQHMGHQKINLKTTSDDPLYLKLIEQQKLWLRLNPSIMDVYTLRLNEKGEVVLIVDSETDYNRDNKIEGDKEMRTRIGEPVPILEPVLAAAFKGQGGFIDTPYSDRWGTWVSAYVPMLDDFGQVEGVLGIDYPATDLIKSMMSQRFFVLSLVGLLGIILLSIYANGKAQAEMAYKRYLIEKDLAESNAKLVKITNAIPGVVYQYQLWPTGAQKIIFMSQGASKVFGIEHTKIMEDFSLIWALLLPEEVEGVVESINVSAQTLTPWEKIFRIKLPSGEMKWIQGSSTPEGRGKDGSIVWNGIFSDVSAQKMFEEELARQREQNVYNSKMASLGEMASGIAHEINTPLAIVSGRAEHIHELLQDGHIDKNLAIQFLIEIKTMTSRIAKIVRGLRSFARDASSDPFMPVAVKTILEDALVLFNERLKNLQIHLKVESYDEKLVCVCRATEVSQVLLNLLVNAEDAMENTVDREIVVRVIESEDQVNIEVENTGAKIPNELKKKIFEPFFTTKDVGKGTGLGLSISKAILDRHHGDLYLDANKERTCFVIRLPKEIPKSTFSPNHQNRAA